MITHDSSSNQSEIRLAVRYSETDAMRFVYYANYFVYFEVARTTALGELGFPYHEMEKNGILIPVLRSHCEYKSAARYGDELLIKTHRWRLGFSQIRFEYFIECHNRKIASGYTEHAFMHPEGRAIRPPKDLLALFP